MKMMMSCTHYVTIADVHILYCCLLLFYRDASVLYSRTCWRDSYRTLCIRHLTDVPICKLMTVLLIYAFLVQNCVFLHYILLISLLNYLFVCLYF